MSWASDEDDPVGLHRRARHRSCRSAGKSCAATGSKYSAPNADRDIEITSGTYVGLYLAHAGITGSDMRSTSDLSVDNLEVTGALAAPSTDSSDTSDSSSLFLLDVNAADIEAGLLDNAEVTTFLVNSDDPDLHQLILRSGWIGGITRTAEGQYKTELRGLTQALSQGIVRTYGVGCDAELGDARCRVDMAPRTTTSSVITVVVSRREFTHDAADLLDSLGQVPGGTVTWTSGENTGYSMEIKEYVLEPGPNRLVLYLPMPLDIAPGDTFTFRPGCDKQHATCLAVYNNIPNFRGHGFFVPGESEILKVGKR